MKITVEISMYPLREKYEEPILDFIAQLNKYPNVKVTTNSTSTHLNGELDEVFRLLQIEIEQSFEKYGKVIMVSKILNADLPV